MTQRAPKLHHIEPDAQCRNCGAVLTGRYCQSCGQKADSALPSLRQLLQEWLHEYLEFDGKILRTMRFLLFSPGRLTKEFLDGRRVRYISPIRLYLIWSVAFFSLLSITPQSGTPPIRVAVQPAVVGSVTPSGNKVIDRLRIGAINVQKDKSALIAKLTKWWPSVMFALVPVFGALVWVGYRKVVRFYLPHLYFGIHVHAFIFFVLCAAQLIRIPLVLVLAGTARSIVLGLLDLGLEALVIPYVIVALHWVYGGSWAGAILRGIAAVVGYTALVFAAVIVVAIAAVMTMT